MGNPPSNRDHTEIVEIIKEREALFRRLAKSDLPIAADARRALRFLNDQEPPS